MQTTQMKIVNGLPNRFYVVQKLDEIKRESRALRLILKAIDLSEGKDTRPERLRERDQLQGKDQGPQDARPRNAKSRPPPRFRLDARIKDGNKCMQNLFPCQG